MEGVRGKVVIITGASSGIGEATARVLAGKGAKVMLAARREDRLKKLADEIGATAEYKVTNVAKHSDMLSLAETTIDRFGWIDVLVNNAGIMPLSFYESRQVSEWDAMIDVNIKGVLYGIDAVLTHMMERGSGQIINVSSVMGHWVNVGSGIYSGTKFAVRAISEGLRQETAGKLRVTIICPGAVTTELGNRITDPKVLESRGDGPGFELLPPEAIGNAVAYAIEQPEGVSVNEIIVRPTGQQT